MAEGQEEVAVEQEAETPQEASELSHVRCGLLKRMGMPSENRKGGDPRQCGALMELTKP